MDPRNKFAKISYLHQSMNKKLSQFGIFHKKLSIDESMVQYFEKHSAKMHVRGNPICFDYKLWSLCGNDEFPYQSNIYTGKDSSKRPEKARRQQLVLNQLDVVLKHPMSKYHEVYFDNSFTSSKLLDVLSSIEFAAVETVRENKTDSASNLKISNKDIKKKSRGIKDYRCN